MKTSKTKQLKPKLKPLPCPFCGKKPRLLPRSPDVEGDAWGAVACVNRRCAANPRCADGEKQADSRGTGAYIDCAIRRWNRRASPVELNDGGLTQCDMHEDESV